MDGRITNRWTDEPTDFIVYTIRNCAASLSNGCAGMKARYLYHAQLYKADTMALTAHCTLQRLRRVRRDGH